jgi:hypothetical protein
MVHELTGTANMPAALRLFVGKWIGAEAPSVQQFASELKFFARPNGPVLIRAVYERCVNLIGTGRSREKRRRVQPVETTVARRKWSVPRRALPAAAVLACVVAGGWLWRGANGVPALAYSPSLRQPFWNAARTVRDAASGLLDSLAPPPRASGSANVGSAAPVAPPAPPSRSTRSAPASVRPVRLAARPPLPASSTIPPHLLLPGVLGAPDDGRGDVNATPSVKTQPLSAIAGDERRLYSGTDVDVDPPRIRYPQLPPPLDGADVHTMELVISERGAVERVKLVSQPRGVEEVMLLHAAKTWQFDPASRDGRPVRYRLVLSWAAAP